MRNAELPGVGRESGRPGVDSLTPMATEGDVGAFRAQMDGLPQPVAIALGRLVRGWTLPEQLDAAIKAAEIITRYVAVVSLASYSCRETTEPAGDSLVSLSGPLSFGHYLSLIKEIVARPEQHPLAHELAAGFRTTKSGKVPLAVEALDKLIELRNKEGHELRHLDPAKALAISRRDDPLAALDRVLRGLVAVLKLPLFVVEHQRIERGTITATVLMLQGENPPFPEAIDLGADLHQLRTPYLGTRAGALVLSPGLTWDLVERHETFGLFFLDRVDDDRVRHKAVADGSLLEDTSTLLESLRAQLAGPTGHVEPVALADGRSLARWWGERAAPPPRSTADEGVAASREKASAPNPMPPPEAKATPRPEPSTSAPVRPKDPVTWDAPDPADEHPHAGVKDPRLTRTNLIRWLAEEDRTLSELAEALEIPRLWIKQALTNLGIESLASESAKGVAPSVDQIKRYEAGEPIGAIASELLVPQTVALRALVRQGAELRVPDSERIGGAQPRISRAFLEREYVEGRRTLESIAEEVGITRERVRQIRSRYGIPPVERSVDPATVVSRELLRQLFVVQGLPLEAIADQVGLRPDEITDLAKRYELARPRVYERHGLTKELLEREYVGQRKSMATIAGERNVPVQAVHTALMTFGIPIRSRRDAISRGLSDVLTPEYLKARLHAGATIKQIAEDNGCTAATVNSYLEAAGLRPPAEPDPRWDDVLSVERLQSDLLATDLTIAEFAAATGAPQAEIRLRLRRAGLSVPRRQNARLSASPTPTEVRDARAAGAPPSFPISPLDLAEQYVGQGRSAGEIAAELEVERTDVLRALCAAGIEVRTNAADILSEPYLRRRYVEDGAPASTIAAEVQTTGATVKRYLKRYGIPVRDHADAGALRTGSTRGELTPDFLRQEYVEGGRSAQSIGEEVGTSAKVVLDAVRAAGLPVRDRRGGPGSSNHLSAVLTPDYLHQALVVEERSIRDLAEEHHTTYRTIRRLVEQAGIDRDTKRAEG